jgi:hypothetical protein
MEIVGNQWRSTISILYHVTFPLGICIMTGVSYLQRDWRDFHFTLSALSALFLVYWWWVKQCWLLLVFSVLMTETEQNWIPNEVESSLNWRFSVTMPSHGSSSEVSYNNVQVVVVCYVNPCRPVEMYSPFADHIASIIRVYTLTFGHLCQATWRHVP